MSSTTKTEQTKISPAPKPVAPMRQPGDAPAPAPERAEAAPAPAPAPPAPPSETLGALPDTRPAPVSVVRWRVVEKAKAVFNGGRHALAAGKILDESSLGAKAIESIRAQGVKLERVE